MPQCGIYKIINIQTNKIYIGQAINIGRRWTEHKNRAFDPNSSSYNTPLDRSIRKYGKDSFVLEIVEECPASMLNEKEIEYIKLFNCITPNGYNVLPGGNSSFKEVRYCKECGAILSFETKGELCHLCYPKTTRKVERPSKEELYNLLIENKGNFSKLGRIFGVCDNSIRKWCILYNLPFHSSDYKNKKILQIKKPVVQIDKDTDQIINIFKSISDASKALGKNNSSHIVEACQGKLKTAYGFKWQYFNKDN